MLQKYFEYVEVSGLANQEVTKTLLTSTEEEPKRVLEVLVYESTSTRQNNAVLRVYVERERVAELPIRAFLDQASTPVYPNGAGRIPLEVDLPVGQSLIVGHVSGSTASNVVFIAVYEIAA